MEEIERESVIYDQGFLCLQLPTMLLKECTSLQTLSVRGNSITVEKLQEVKNCSAFCYIEMHWYQLLWFLPEGSFFEG